jgi:hypothetical protein
MLYASISLKDITVNTYVKMLSPEHIEKILQLEEACFEPCLRASEATLKSRFSLGHIMLGLYTDDTLIGLASFAYKWFDSKEETKLFCQNYWHPFYKMNMETPHNTVMIYNVELLPSKRNVTHIYTLLNAMMKKAYTDGCQFLIGISRIPSYKGDTYNHIEKKDSLSNALDQYIKDGIIPKQSILLKDPLIHLYKHIGRCEVLTVIKDYLPEDIPSGGIRAIVYTELTNQWEVTKGTNINE